MDSQYSAMDERKQPLNGQYIVYKKRWVLLFILCVFQISNAAMWMTFGPIAKTAKIAYDTNDTAINWLSQIFMLLYLPLGFTSSWALDAKGLKFGVVLGGALNAIGGFVRYAAEGSDDPHTKLVVVFIGQSLTACAQPFILNAPTKLAATWFGDDERTLANMMASISNPLGIAVAMVLSPMIVENNDVGALATCLLVYAIFGAVAFIGAAFFDNEPPTPPSASAAEPSDAFMDGLKKVAFFKHYIILFIGFGMGIGFFNAFTTLLLQIVQPHGYTEDDSSVFGAVCIGAGLVGAGITGPVIDKTKRYKEVLKINFVLACCAFLFFNLVLDSGVMELVAVASGCIGFCCFSILPVALELGVESTYPVQEGTSAGFLWMSGQVFGIIFISTMNALKETPEKEEDFGDMTTAIWLLFGLACVSAVLILFFNSPYLRMEAERKQREIRAIDHIVDEESHRP